MNAIMILTIIVLGVLAHLAFFHSGNIAKILFSNRGEGKTGDGGDAGKGGDGGGDKSFTQADVDRIVTTRLERESKKYSDYEDLKKFKTEHDKQQDQKAQEDLVKQKKYEEAENNYKKQINDLSGKLTEKDNHINDLNINHKLSTLISAENGYIEDSLPQLRSKTSLDANGNLIMKITDANGVVKDIPAVDGVKQFLKEKPYLVRSTHKQGGGTGASHTNGAGSGTGGTGQGEDLNTLNQQLSDAMKSRDLKKISELKQKIRAKVGEKTTMIAR